jgi:hypothetical protein
MAWDSACRTVFLPVKKCERSPSDATALSSKYRLSDGQKADYRFQECLGGQARMAVSS